MRGHRGRSAAAAAAFALLVGLTGWSGTAAAKQAPAAPAVRPSTARSSTAPAARGPAPSPVPKTRQCRRPADVVDLTNWSVTLPAPDAPVTIKQPLLATYAQAPFFAAQGCAVRFEAPVTSATTPNSRYPRSELREMTNRGRAKAAWSSGVGRHELDVDLAFTRLPAVKPQLVGAQVHDATDDIITLRLQGTRLWIAHRDVARAAPVTDHYRLGTRLRVRFVVERNVVQAFVDDRLVARFAESFDHGYFKTGAYTQANCSNSAPCDATNAGGVLLYRLRVLHTGS